MTAFSFRSTVVSSTNPLIEVGDTISGTAAYDESQPGLNGVYVFTGSAKTHTFSWTAYHNGIAKAAGRFGPSGGLFVITVSYNATVNGVIGTLVNIRGAVAGGRYTFSLNLFDAGNAGVINNALPNQAKLVNFDLNASHSSV